MSILSGIIWTVIEIFLIPENFSSGIFYINSALRFSFLMIIVLALYMLRSTLDSEKNFAREDSLTGIANRRAFYERAEVEMERLRRNKRPLSVAYLDLDNFKAVNDILGHEVGDRVLTVVGSVIEKNIRKTDLVARLGGDEFAILMPESGCQQAELILKRIQQDLLNAMKQNVWFITFSIGVVVYNTAPNDVNELVKTADRVMYSAKDSGKNSINISEVS
ncbi:MAG: GGDEF domain-containing protein [Bacillota bacterium]